MRMSLCTNFDAEHLYFGACYGSAVILAASPAAAASDEGPANRNLQPERHAQVERDDLR